MTNRPPSPASPVPSSGDASEDSVLVTTSHLAASIEDALGYRMEESTLDEFLLELDRGDYVDWVDVTRSGDYVWDLSESPEKLGDALAEAAVSRFTAWLQGDA